MNLATKICHCHIFLLVFLVCGDVGPSVCLPIVLKRSMYAITSTHVMCFHKHHRPIRASVASIWFIFAPQRDAPKNWQEILLFRLMDVTIWFVRRAKRKYTYIPAVMRPIENGERWFWSPPVGLSIQLKILLAIRLQCACVRVCRCNSVMWIIYVDFWECNQTLTHAVKRFEDTWMWELVQWSHIYGHTHTRVQCAKYGCWCRNFTELIGNESIR